MFRKNELDKLAKMFEDAYNAGFLDKDTGVSLAGVTILMGDVIGNYSLITFRYRKQEYLIQFSVKPTSVDYALIRDCIARLTGSTVTGQYN